MLFSFPIRASCLLPGPKSRFLSHPQPVVRWRSQNRNCSQWPVGRGIPRGGGDELVISSCLKEPVQLNWWGCGDEVYLGVLGELE